MYKITCVHPTCRPKLARDTRDKWLKLAKNSNNVEYITCFDSLDKNEIKKKIKKNKNIIEIYEKYSFGIVKKCNLAGKLASANCIIVATDDTIPEKNWDEKVINSADWSQEIVLNTSDGTENVDKRPYMVKTVILSKKRYKKLGYILHPEFSHVYCDNFHTWISHRDDVVIHRKDIMFEHLHPSMGKSVPDEFYIKASTPDEYNKGSKIFHDLIKKNFDKNTEKKIISRFISESNPFKKYISAYVLITSGFDKNKLLEFINK